MGNVYFLSAAVGSTILVVQVLLQLLGLGAEQRRRSIQSAVAFLALFGLAGVAAQRLGGSAGSTLAAAIVAGAVAVVVVGWAMTALAERQCGGDVDLANAVGSAGRVHLLIPGANAGRGKVIVEVQGRRVQCRAITRGAGLPTGARVIVVAALGPDTVEVEVLPSG